MTDSLSSVQSRLLRETARIHWRELQRFFAAGTAIAVDDSLDLLVVAEVIANDNAAQLRAWMDNKAVDVVPDAQAARWYEDDAEVWAVVIKPWVLVQQRKEA